MLDVMDGEEGNNQVERSLWQRGVQILVEKLDARDILSRSMRPEEGRCPFAGASSYSFASRSNVSRTSGCAHILSLQHVSDYRRASERP